MKLRLACLAFVSAALLAAAPARAAWVWTGWEAHSFAQEACLQVANDAIANAGFSGRGDGQTSFGWRGEDNISIRCIADRGLAVFFVYVRTSSDDGRQLLERMRSAYRGGGNAPFK